MKGKLEQQRTEPYQRERREKLFLHQQFLADQIFVHQSFVSSVQGGLAFVSPPEQQIKEQNPPTSVSTVEEQVTGKETAAKVAQGTARNKTSEDKYISLKSKLLFLRYKNENFYNDESDKNNVKGRLRKRLKVWKDIGANKFILDVIENGYKLPFISTPTNIRFKNNMSAVKECHFVSESIRELLSSGSIIKVPFQPEVISPLSVATSQSGKKRLILDLRHVNQFLHKEYIKFDDWRAFQHYVTQSGYLFKFDLRKGYHHIDIFPEHQLFLGFSWPEKDGEYYVFTVLPFGLSPAPNAFTKLLRALVRVWHQQGIKICVFLDDGAGAGDSFEETTENSKITKTLLINCGFVINDEKSFWVPTKHLTWLGISVDLRNNTYSISSERISSLVSCINKLLLSPYTTARILSRLAGKIVSMKFVLLNIIRLKSRYIYKVIDEQRTWDNRLNILNYPEAHREIIFWRDNIIKLNVRNINSDSKSPEVFMFSDASNSGIGAISSNKNLKCHKLFNRFEQSQSSTWRELEAIRFSIKSLDSPLKNKNVLWKTDNRAASIIVSSGSRNLKLQELAMQIFNICRELNITLEVQWISREFNKDADALSKIVDADDWELSHECFDYLNNIWGPFSIDRFADHVNHKVERFNSKFFVPGTEAVDAFSQNWELENNLFVPPVKEISRTLIRIKSASIKGVLVIPYWLSAEFWAVVQKNGQFIGCIKDWVLFNDASTVLKPGSFNFGLLGNPEYHGSIIALRVDSSV